MIDWQRLRILRDEVGPDDFDEVLDLFAQEVESILSDLSPDNAAAQIEAQMHALKGAALNLGFDDFSVLCSRNEKRARDGEIPQIDLSAVTATYFQSKAVLKDGITAQLSS